MIVSENSESEYGIHLSMHEFMSLLIVESDYFLGLGRAVGSAP